MSATAEIQAYVRALTATAYSYEGDLHALCDLAGVPVGHLLERLGALLETLPQGVLALLQNGSVEELLAPHFLAPLFAAGEQGVWYDPSDFSTLFQDSAGTVPVTAVEQPVGLMLDKSGRGNHARQATTTKRPVLKIDAGGRYYLSFDGVDDALQTGNINFTGTNKMTVWAGVTKLSDAAPSILLEISDNVNTNSGAFCIAAPEQSGASTFLFKSRGSLPSGAVKVFGNAAPISRVVAAIGDIAGDITSLRVNGVATTGTPDQGAGNYGNYPLYIGARAGTSFFFNGRLYGLIVRGAASSAAQIAAVERFMAQKTGVTL